MGLATWACTTHTPTVTSKTEMMLINSGAYLYVESKSELMRAKT